jgi:O-antigen/teichoic acid export membrane protein
MVGATITIIGAALTILVNYLLIPHLGYLACAIATVFCYGSMMIISYVQGQKHYPIPYDLKNGMLYITIALALFGIHFALRSMELNIFLLHSLATIFIMVFLAIVVKKEKQELIKIPFLQKIYRLKN